MDYTQIILSIVTGLVAIGGGYFGYLQIVVPIREKNKAADSHQTVERLKAERDMWKEKAHASEAQAEVEKEKRIKMEMRHKLGMSEFINVLEAMEMLEVNPQTIKIIELLKSKLQVNVTPAQT